MTDTRERKSLSGLWGCVGGHGSRQTVGSGENCVEPWDAGRKPSPKVLQVWRNSGFTARKERVPSGRHDIFTRVDGLRKEPQVSLPFVRPLWYSIGKSGTFFCGNRSPGRSCPGWLHVRNSVAVPLFQPAVLGVREKRSECGPSRRACSMASPGWGGPADGPRGTYGVSTEADESGSGFPWPSGERYLPQKKGGLKRKGLFSRETEQSETGVIPMLRKTAHLALAAVLLLLLFPQIPAEAAPRHREVWRRCHVDGLRQRNPVHLRERSDVGLRSGQSGALEGHGG